MEPQWHPIIGLPYSSWDTRDLGGVPRLLALQSPPSLRRKPPWPPQKPQPVPAQLPDAAPPKAERRKPLGETSIRRLACRLCIRSLPLAPPLRQRGLASASLVDRSPGGARRSLSRPRRVSDVSRIEAWLPQQDSIVASQSAFLRAHLCSSLIGARCRQQDWALAPETKFDVDSHRPIAAPGLMMSPAIIQLVLERAFWLLAFAVRTNDGWAGACGRGTVSPKRLEAAAQSGSLSLPLLP